MSGKRSVRKEPDFQTTKDAAYSRLLKAWRVSVIMQVGQDLRKLFAIYRPVLCEELNHRFRQKIDLKVFGSIRAGVLPAAPIIRLLAHRVFPLYLAFPSDRIRRHGEQLRSPIGQKNAHVSARVPF